LTKQKSEFEVPPQTKVRVVATVDRRLCEEMELIHEKEVKLAKDEIAVSLTGATQSRCYCTKA
jgi:hypothetical protein